MESQIQPKIDLRSGIEIYPNKDDFVLNLNEIDYHFDDPKILGRQALSTADFDPAEDYVLIELLHRETRSISLDESIELRCGEKRVFKAFLTDRIFRFSINSKGYEWGTHLISELELRRISDTPEDFVLILDREDGDQELKSSDLIDLSKPGSERIRSVSRLVRVYLNGDEKKIERGEHTTEQLIIKLGVEPGYILNLLNEQGELVTLKPGEILKAKEGMRFFSQVPQGASA